MHEVNRLAVTLRAFEIAVERRDAVRQCGAELFELAAEDVEPGNDLRTGAARLAR